jgi:hypothetical protein
MRGIPTVFNTKQDWLNAHQYALVEGDDPHKAVFKERLRALKGSGTMLVLKDGAPEDPEDQAPADFEAVDDPASPLARSGLTAAEIDLMISQLG